MMAGCDLTDEQLELVKSAVDAAAAASHSWNTGGQRAAGCSAFSTQSQLQELGRQLLQHAADGEADHVEALMARGAPLTSDWLGTSPLHMAAMYGHRDVAELLLSSGIVRDVRTKVDKTPLHFAAAEGYADIVELLLVNGASVDLRDMLNMTALHWAVERNHISCVEWVLRYGADVHAKNKFGKTPFDIAADNSNSATREVLRNHELYRSDIADNNATNNDNTADQQQQAILATQMAVDSILTDSYDCTSDSKIGSHVTTASLTASSNRCVVTSQATVATNAVSANGRVVRVKNGALNTQKSVSTSPLTSSPLPISGKSEALRLLASHGITLMPADNTVPTSLTSGKRVSITAAGALALGQTKSELNCTVKPVAVTTTTTSSSSSLPSFKITTSPAATTTTKSIPSGSISLAVPGSTGCKITKVIRITPQQLAKLAKKSSNGAQVVLKSSSALTAPSPTGTSSASVEHLTAPVSAETKAVRCAEIASQPPAKRVKFVPYNCVQSSSPTAAGSTPVSTSQAVLPGDILSTAVATVSSTTQSDDPASSFLADDDQMSTVALQQRLVECQLQAEKHRQLAAQLEADMTQYRQLLNSRLSTDADGLDSAGQ